MSTREADATVDRDDLPQVGEGSRWLPGHSRHGPIAQLLIASAPLSLILVAYAAAQWISAPLADGGDTNRLGFGVHVTGPAHVDQVVFGVVPSVWLQQRLVDGAPQWYDAVAALVYVTHFVSIPVVTALAWFRARERFPSWLGAVIAFTILGMTGYVLYPAAPPWLASDHGDIGAVDRVSTLGWHYLDLTPVATASTLGQAASNPVAAMPSLHAGAALLAAAFLWPAVGYWWRTVLLAYVLLMALTLVYTGEHYVVDVVAGWLTAGIAVTIGAAVHRLRPSP
jgi:membrane-associated phospholipid phosphatase